MNIFFDASLETSDLIHTKNQAIVFLNMADMKRWNEDLSWLFKLVEMLSVTNNENRLMLILAPRDGRQLFIYVLKANAGWLTGPSGLCDFVTVLEGPDKQFHPTHRGLTSAHAHTCSSEIAKYGFTKNVKKYLLKKKQRGFNEKISTKEHAE